MGIVATTERESDAPQAPPLSPEDQARANIYALLGNLLAAPANRELLELLGDLDAPGSQDRVGRAWALLRLAAREADPSGVDDEFHDLFIGLGRGELVPCASWYITGLTMDRPLALLRRDLELLGIERQAGVSEPEDHVGALCEAMAVIIQSRSDISETAQRQFFSDHIEPWMHTFFRDLQEAKTASFYRAVGHLGQEFMRFEQQYLSFSD